MSNPPKQGESAEQYLARCADAAGENLPTVSPSQIAELERQGYRVNRHKSQDWDDCGYPIFLYQWSHGPTGDFQDVEPSYSANSAWALALQHSQEIHA